MAPKRNLYGTLGILRSSTDGEIRAAYKRRALETHPDKGGDHESFLKVIGAFTALSDPIERAKYDAQLTQRKDSDGISLPGAAPAKAQRAKRKVEEPPRPTEPPKERSKERPKERPKEPKEQPKKDQAPKAAGSNGSTASDEANVAWKDLLTAPPEQQEETWFRKFTWRFVTQILEVGRCSIDAERSQRAQDGHGRAPRAKRRLKRLADIPAARKPGNMPKLQIQRHIRKLGRGKQDRFHCTMCFNFLEVGTELASSLAEAIDWHICLTRFRHAALRIMEEPLTEGPDDSHARILAALDAAFKEHLEQGGSRPKLMFSLRLYLRNPEPENEINPRKYIMHRLFATPNLEWVLQAHAKMRRAMSEGDQKSSREIMVQLRRETGLASAPVPCHRLKDMHQQLGFCMVLPLVAKDSKNHYREISIWVDETCSLTHIGSGWFRDVANKNWGQSRNLIRSGSSELWDNKASPQWVGIRWNMFNHEDQPWDFL
eukprot:Skav225609  [mRNA]  locus=scaffold3871:151595:153984:- [translate_table: standard]